MKLTEIMTLDTEFNNKSILSDFLKIVSIPFHRKYHSTRVEETFMRG